MKLVAVRKVVKRAPRKVTKTTRRARATTVSRVRAKPKTTKTTKTTKTKVTPAKPKPVFAAFPKPAAKAVARKVVVKKPAPKSTSTKRRAPSRFGVGTTAKAP